MTTTIVMPVSRPDYLRQVFTSLEYLDCDPAQTNLFVYVDGPQTNYEVARNLTVNSKFGQRLCVYRGKKRIAVNVGSVKRRRERIADIHNEVKTHLQPVDYLLLTEDDTLMPKSTLRKLTSTFISSPATGIVSGVELGRWGYAHIGAWEIDDVYDPTVIKSVSPNVDVKPVDAAGLYACLTKYENYINHHFQPFDQVLGPDVNFGISLRRQGLINYIDHDVKCTHLTKRGRIECEKTDIVSIQSSKIDAKWSGWVSSESNRY